MRKGLVIAIIALTVVAGLIPATAGAAPRVRYYEGPTSEGGRLRISVVVKDGVPYLDLLLIDGPYTCEDGTRGQIVDDGIGWSPRGPAIRDGQIQLSENWRVVAFMVSGHLGSLRGSGTLAFLIPALTADEQAAQVCTLGEVTWSVERTDTSFSLNPTMKAEATEGRSLAIGLGVAGSQDSTTLAQTEMGPIRHYRGRTTPLDGPIAVKTSRAETGIALLSMAIGFSLACEDGAELKGWRTRAYFGTTQVMPPGRLDLDLAPTPDALGLGNVWLHLHGELDRHFGSGALSIILPRLTDDLGAQLCQTGDQDWRLWRTDAGY